MLTNYDILREKAEELEIKAVQMALTSKHNFELFNELVSQEHFRNHEVHKIVLAIKQFESMPEVANLVAKIQNPNKEYLQLCYTGGSHLALENSESVYKDLIEISKRLHILILMNEYIKDISNVASDPESLTTALEMRISTILDESKDEILNQSEIIADTIGYIEQDLTSISTGMIGVDNLTNGFNLGELWVIGARPSVGKSALGLSYAYNVSIKSNTAMVYVSYEMKKEDIMLRLCAMHTGIEAYRIKHKKINSQEKQRVYEFFEIFRSKKLFIVDKCGFYLNDLKRIIKKFKKRYDIKIVIVDYIQLMKTESKTKLQQVSEISGDLKQEAMLKDLCILALAQVNRDSEKEKRRNYPSDLKESGSLEQDADVVLMIERPKQQGRKEFHNGTSDHSGNGALLHFDKCRNGSTGSIMTNYIGSQTYFAEVQGVTSEF